ncbi:toll/interleukin-1 receptor domain-containing adapter protein [Pristis pectinata]|uniref:toll/interleukin-1 receptor domain-containing adapter protein n=1 Tax=Pristis pectinata TaxID=685728 RepID=UPI00223D1CA6|nr:toll/interleukin-1 receptor domain-containing adapter protein [Pristis pectinata]XP_051895940.1 toll/interleukin-1 receptor domain-containing adapter protein [Pristis pectinata]XP_051895941.1 toll/interleukin-1 receptor domain-containing adapter protein [Pristis pectinata]
MARFFGWFRDLKRNRNRNQNPNCSPQPSDRTKSRCQNPRSNSTSSQPVADSSSSWKFDSKARWGKEYDVCICHAEDDVTYVQDLVSFLELRPHSLRCFLQLRDLAPGGAVCTELCQAVRESHCWVLVISPSFLKDPWCWYQMQQALSESPTANGRVIPVRKQLERKDYPQELRFMFGIDVRLDKENGFQKIKRAILYYLEELCRKEREEQRQRDTENCVDTVSNTTDLSGTC